MTVLGHSALGTADHPYDVFLCYKSEDVVAAKALRAALVARGLRVFLDVIEGEIWAPLSRSISEALARSRSLVALVTKNFPISPHCRDELHAALTASYYLDKGSTSRVMAVVRGVSPDEVRPRQLTTVRLPYSNVAPEEVVESIVRNVAAHDGLFGDAPVLPNPRWYPYERPGGPFFQGRYAELWDLHYGLRAREKTKDLGPPVMALSGPGGQGKTSLCLQYARLFARDHPGGVFVLELGGSDDRAEPSDALVRTRFREQLAQIAVGLHVEPHPAEIAAALDRRGQPYLWILDDVPAATSREVVVRMYAPTPAGRTLVTSRAPFDRFASHGCVLDPLGARAGEAVLTAGRPALPSERAAVRGIVQMFGAHPLSLAIAAGLTEAPDFAGYPGLLADLSSAEPDRLESAQLRSDLPPGCARPFSRVLLRSFKSLDRTAQDVLCAASVLAPTVIPHDLLAGMVRRAGGMAAAQAADGVARCAARGLLARDSAGCTMHAVVARAVRLLVWPASRRARLRDAALVELTEAVERTRDGYRHRELMHHAPHVRAVVGLLAGGDAWPIGLDELHLGNETGRVQLESGRSGDGLTLFQALYQACQVDDVDWYTRTVVVLGLAAAHEREGRYSTAVRMGEEAVGLFTSELGPNAEETLTALNNLGVALSRLGRYEEAHTILRRVYEGRRDHRKLGPTHRDTLIALNNLAIARGHLGASPEERNRHRRVAHWYWLASWDRWRMIARPDDQDQLDALNGLALSFRALGRPMEALALLTELHDRRTALLGPDHPDTLGTLENKLIVREELRDRGGDL